MTENLYEETPFHQNWTELISPKETLLDVDKDTHTESYGKFVCQPLERGFATTIGNSLRRLLLSSIQGAAITSVRIDGALHEFTAIDGILEDVTEIILNLKEIRLKLNTEEGKTVTIDKRAKGPVTAADIISDGSVEIMNPDQHICTITGDGHFKAELEVKWGKGYRPAELNKSEEHAIGVIPIDSIFTPVKKVQYIVTQARVGQQTDYDKLTLEMHTDGSVTPENALAYAAKILKEQMTLFINFDEQLQPKPDTKTEKRETPQFNDNLYRSVEELELSVRSANCLKNADINKIYQLVSKTEPEMLKTKNFGRKSLNEIKEVLTEMGLSLGMKIEGFTPPEEETEEGEQTV